MVKFDEPSSSSQMSIKKIDIIKYFIKTTFEIAWNKQKSLKNHKSNPNL
jgi:hypothetical protein